MPQENPSLPNGTRPKDLPRVVVDADAASGYQVQTADSITRTSVPLEDVPASIQVVPRELMTDRGVTRTNQLLDTVSGVLAESSYGGNGATFFNIRGFSENNGLRDGFREYGYLAYRDVQNIEQVEVFKGPAGALYGGIGAVGGYVNTVSKRPVSKDRGDVATTFESYGESRTTLDVNKALDNGVSMRLNAAYDEGSSFRHDVSHHAWSIAPAVSWHDGEGNALTLLTEFNHLNRNDFDFGIPNVSDYRQLSRTRYDGPNGGTYPGVDDDYASNTTNAASLLFEHAFNDDWKLRAAAHYSYAHQVSQQTFPNLDTYTGGDLLDFSVYSGANEASRQYAAQTELEGQFSTGKLTHALLAGMDYGFLEQGGAGSAVSTLTLDLRDPAFVAPVGATVPASPYHQAQGKDTGVYVQDLIDLGAAWKMQLGLRADRFVNRELSGGSEVAQGTQNTLSPRVGLVWQPDSVTSVFADWSRSHAPNVAHSTSNSTYDAEIGEQVELGIKHDIVENRLSASLALFDLKRENILTSDPLDPMKQILTGKQASRGVEVDMAGALSPAWKLTASYTYTDATVKSDTSLPVGDALSNVPRHHASAWTKYDFQSVALQGLGAGLGVYYVGRREANLPNTYELASYVRTDAALYFQGGAWRTQLNVFNLFNRRYYTGGSASVFNYTLDPSRPVTAQWTVSYRFE